MSCLLTPGSMMVNLRHFCTLLCFCLCKPGLGRVGLLQRLEAAEVPQGRYTFIELKRITFLSQQGYWTDVPRFEPKRGTPVAHSPKMWTHRDQCEPYLPFPDAFVREAGWRVLWIVRELGPPLLALTRQLADIYRRFPLRQGRLDTSVMATRMRHFIPIALAFDWKGNSGPIHGFPFEHELRSKGGGGDFQWPPRRPGEMMALLHLLQVAHFFIFALSIGGRLGEVLSLQPDCLVEGTQPGEATVQGRTYKLVFENEGEMRDWPLPAVGVEVIRQQIVLGELLNTLQSDKSMVSKRSSGYKCIWVSSNPKSAVPSFSCQLQMLVRTLRLRPWLGDGSPHSHRFRKTIARLIALTIDGGAPKILMDLFGHKAIEMSLHYMLADRKLQTELVEVIRAQKIMLAEGMLQTSGHGGPAAPRIAQALEAEKMRIKALGKVFTAGDLTEFATLLTDGGKAWMLVRPGVVCTKSQGEVGPCNKRRGTPEPSSCQSYCGHRLEDAFLRNDVDLVLARAVDQMECAEKSGHEFELELWRGQVLAHLPRFDDLKSKWEMRPSVSRLLEQNGKGVLRG